ncbi:glycogen synthase [Sarotherodon galilaeus]
MGHDLDHQLHSGQISTIPPVESMPIQLPRMWPFPRHKLNTHLVYEFQRCIRAFPVMELRVLVADFQRDVTSSGVTPGNGVALEGLTAIHHRRCHGTSHGVLCHGIRSSGMTCDIYNDLSNGQ